MRIGGGSESSFAIWGSHSGGAVPLRIGAHVGGLDPPKGATAQRRPGGADRPNRHPPDANRPLGGPRGPWIERIGRGRRSGGLGATLALSAWDVLVHRLMLPAVLPLAVDRQLRFAPRLGAHAPRGVGLVRSRKVPDGRPPESVVRHGDSHPFLRAGCGLPAPQYPLRTAGGPGSFPFRAPTRRTQGREGSRMVTLASGCDTHMTEM
jgi:hypothetical protein